MSPASADGKPAVSPPCTVMHAYICHVQALLAGINTADAPAGQHENEAMLPGQSYSRMLHAWRTPVGPHLAAELEGELLE